MRFLFCSLCSDALCTDFREISLSGNVSCVHWKYSHRRCEDDGKCVLIRGWFFQDTFCWNSTSKLWISFIQVGVNCLRCVVLDLNCAFSFCFWQAIERLNIKPKYWQDLISNEPFTRKDLITIQDPDNLEKFNYTSFYHIRKNLKLDDGKRLWAKWLSAEDSLASYRQVECTSFWWEDDFCCIGSLCILQISEEEKAKTRAMSQLKTVNAETTDILSELEKEYKPPVSCFASLLYSQIEQPSYGSISSGENMGFVRVQLSPGNALFLSYFRKRKQKRRRKQIWSML